MTKWTQIKEKNRRKNTTENTDKQEDLRHPHQRAGCRCGSHRRQCWISVAASGGSSAGPWWRCSQWTHGTWTHTGWCPGPSGGTPPLAHPESPHNSSVRESFCCTSFCFGLVVDIPVAVHTRTLLPALSLYQQPMWQKCYFVKETDCSLSILGRYSCAHINLGTVLDHLSLTNNVYHLHNCAQ